MAFGYLGTQIQMLVLCDDGEGLTCLHIVATIYHTLLYVAAAWSGNSNTTCTTCTLHTGIGKLGCLILGFSHSKILLAYYLVLDKYLGTGVVALGTFVVDACTLHGVAVCHLHTG